MISNSKGEPETAEQQELKGIIALLSGGGNSETMASSTLGSNGPIRSHRDHSNMALTPRSPAPPVSSRPEERKVHHSKSKSQTA